MSLTGRYVGLAMAESERDPLLVLTVEAIYEVNGLSTGCARPYIAGMLSSLRISIISDFFHKDRRRWQSTGDLSHASQRWVLRSTSQKIYRGSSRRPLHHGGALTYLL